MGREIKQKRVLRGGGWKQPKGLVNNLFFEKQIVQKRNGKIVAKLGNLRVPQTL